MPALDDGQPALAALAPMPAHDNGQPALAAPAPMPALDNGQRALEDNVGLADNDTEMENYSDETLSRPGGQNLF